MGFTLEWDDFSGGYFTGPVAANMDPDTWRGHNVLADPNDGMLYPMTAWTTVTYSAGSPTDAYNGSDRYVAMYSSPTRCYRVYDTSTSNTANVAKFASATGPPLGSGVTVTNTAISTCTRLLHSCAWDGNTILITYLPSSGANNFVVYTPSSAASAVSSIHTDLRLIARYGEFAVGVSLSGTKYRLYYSTAYDPTAWDAADYYDIGDASPISALVPFGDSLYIAKPDGWYVLTGVLGSTAVIRKATEGYPGPTGNVDLFGTYTAYTQTNAVGTPVGIMFTSPQMDCTAAVLNGGVVRPLNFAGTYNFTGQSTVNPVVTISPGLYAVGRYPGVPVNDATTYQAVWLVDMRLGRPRWARIEVPYGASVLQGHFAEQLPGEASSYYQSLWIDKDDTLYVANVYPSVEWWGTTNYTSGTGTVHLAERRRTDPFTVKSLYVELVWSADADAVPSVTARVEMRGYPDIDTPGRLASTAETQAPTTTATNPTAALYHDQRQVHATLRFRPDAVAGTSCVPILTFTECKIRRVWAECESVGRS